MNLFQNVNLPVITALSLTTLFLCLSVVILQSQNDLAFTDINPLEPALDKKDTTEPVKLENKKGIKLHSDHPTPLVNYDAYEVLVKEVKEIRNQKLILFDEFQKYAKEENTVILDTRSKKNYDKIHIEGAIHLPFTEFTEANLTALIPNKDTRVLIYCNNNFYGNDISFMSKVAPLMNPLQKLAAQAQMGNKATNGFGTQAQKSLMLALNTPTYISLAGYGYTDIYELNEFVSVLDNRNKWGGLASEYNEYITGERTNSHRIKSISKIGG